MLFSSYIILLLSGSQGKEGAVVAGDPLYRRHQTPFSAHVYMLISLFYRQWYPHTVPRTRSSFLPRSIQHYRLALSNSLLLPLRLVVRSFLLESMSGVAASLLL
jgi:hypothetical protein